MFTYKESNIFIKGKNAKMLFIISLAVILTVTSFALISIILKPNIKTNDSATINSSIRVVIDGEKGNESNILVDSVQEVYSVQQEALVSKPSTETITYKVKKGDNLVNIAKQFNISVQDIINYNKINNPNLIHPKDTLLIPVNKQKSKVIIASNKPESSDYYLSFDLRNTSDLTINDINRFLKDTGLEGLGQAFLDAENKYNVNAKYLMAHAIHESDWGSSKIALDKKNIFGFKAYDNNPYKNAMSFSTLEDSIDYAASFISKYYLDEHGKYYNGSTLIGMNKNYATSKNWASKIASIMEKFDRTIKRS